MVPEMAGASSAASVARAADSLAAAARMASAVAWSVGGRACQLLLFALRNSEVCDVTG
jgi:hypothetical protein